MTGRSGKILICEEESDTWTVLAYYFAAIVSPEAKNFKAAWIEVFNTRADG